MPKKKNVLTVSQIRIRNILGIESLEFKPGKVATVTGANGCGKTSVIEAIRAALGGGHDASLLREGANKGEVVLILSDGMEISKKVTAGRSPVEVMDPEQGTIRQPQTFLNDLADAFGANPIAFRKPAPRSSWLRTWKRPLKLSSRTPTRCPRRSTIPRH